MQIDTFPRQLRGFKNSPTSSPSMEIHRPHRKDSRSTECLGNLGNRNRAAPSSWSVSQKGLSLCRETPTHLLEDASWSFFQEPFSIPSNCEGFHSFIIFVVPPCPLSNHLPVGYNQSKVEIMKNMNKNVLYSVIKYNFILFLRYPVQSILSYWKSFMKVFLIISIKHRTKTQDILPLYTIPSRKWTLIFF